MDIKQIMDYRDTLIKEIQLIKSRYTPEDTGHLRTAVSVLQERVNELKKDICEKGNR